MIAALLLAAAVVPPVEQAERAFASTAQIKGQWTAFRLFAAPDAQMLLDGPQPAGPFLKDRKDPLVSVMWWPAHTVTSCDGKLAFSTGPWRRKGGQATGRYFTIWRYGAEGWRWIYDGGAEDHSATPAGDKPAAVRAACHGSPAPAAPADQAIGGASDDNSLRWSLRPQDKEHYQLTVSYRSSRGWKTETAIVG